MARRYPLPEDMDIPDLPLMSSPSSESRVQDWLNTRQEDENVDEFGNQDYGMYRQDGTRYWQHHGASGNHYRPQTRTRTAPTPHPLAFNQPSLFGHEALNQPQPQGLPPRYPIEPRVIINPSGQPAQPNDDQLNQQLPVSTRRLPPRRRLFPPLPPGPRSRTDSNVPARPRSESSSSDDTFYTARDEFEPMVREYRPRGHTNYTYKTNSSRYLTVLTEPKIDSDSEHDSVDTGGRRIRPSSINSVDLEGLTFGPGSVISSDGSIGSVGSLDLGIGGNEQGSSGIGCNTSDEEYLMHRSVSQQNLHRSVSQQNMNYLTNPSAAPRRRTTRPPNPLSPSKVFVLPSYADYHNTPIDDPLHPPSYTASQRPLLPLSRHSSSSTLRPSTSSSSQGTTLPVSQHSSSRLSRHSTSPSSRLSSSPLENNPYLRLSHHSGSSSSHHSPQRSSHHSSSSSSHQSYHSPQAQVMVHRDDVSQEDASTAMLIEPMTLQQPRRSRSMLSLCPPCCPEEDDTGESDSLCGMIRPGVVTQQIRSCLSRQHSRTSNQDHVYEQEIEEEESML